MLDTQSLSGLEKAAALILALGTESSAQLVSGLSPGDIELLAGQIARTKSLSVETRRAILQEFQTAVASGRSPEGGLSYARELLTQTLGEEKAASVISRLEFASDSAGFTIEGEKEAERLGRLLRQEHPQIGAAVLSQLPPALAGRALGGLTKEGQLEVALRLVDTDAPDAKALQCVAQELHTTMVSEQPIVVATGDGTRRLAEILNSTDWEIEQYVLGAINDYDPGLCQQVRDKMFVFEDLIELDSRDLQLVLRGVSQDDLRLALSAAGDRLRDYIMSNISERAAAALKEDMASAGEVKPKQARAAQQRIAAAARRLAQEETMTLKRRDEGEGSEGDTGPESDEHGQAKSGPAAQPESPGERENV